MTGCEKCQECEKCSPNIQNKIYSEDELKSVLLQYGKFVYGESDFSQMEDNKYYMSIKDLYENNGYILGKNLIVTHETSKMPLVVGVVDSYIENFLM